MTLQLFIDETGKDTPPYFIMGGFLAPVDVWAEFSDEWNAILARHPSVTSLHTAPAMALKEQFGVWTEGERDDRLRELSSLINRTALGAVLVIVDHKEYDGAPKGRFHPIFDRPYLISLYNALVWECNLEIRSA